jgi:polyisoprenoid-binding protein YceI
MRNHIIFFFLLTFGTQAFSQQYILLTDKSAGDWTGYAEVGGFTQSGTLVPESGFIEVNNGNITSGEIIFDLRKLSHGDKTLEKHLKEKDFFFVRKFPNAIFEISGMDGDMVTGKLTIRGISRDVSFDFGSITKDNILIVEGKASIDRTLFDIKYNSTSYFQDLGSYAIKNEFDLQFKLVFDSNKEN